MDRPEYLKSLIRDVRDFPRPGIVFKDITPLILDGDGFRIAVDMLAAAFADEEIDVIAAPEARGFIFGPPLAYHLGCGFIPIRKPGKLPHDRASITYQLEYGEDTVEIHRDAIKAGDRVLLVDDVLATGGTMQACSRLMESLNGKIVGCLFLMELAFLNGRERLTDHRVEAVLTV